MLKIHFVYPDMQKGGQKSCRPPEKYKTIIDKFIRLDKSNSFKVVNNPKTASFIMLMEPPQTYKPREYINHILSLDVVKKNIEKIYTFNDDDNPKPIFPGVYVSLPKDCFNSNIHRAGVYISLNLEKIRKERKKAKIPSEEKNYLFSFRGTNTAKAREMIFNSKFEESSSVKIIETPMEKFFKWLKDKKGREDYIKDICFSKFVLCPRGYGTSSIRLYETIALGSVPVIISDNWVEPKDIPWDNVSIRISEKDISKIPSILKKYEKQAKKMSEETQKVYNRYLLPELKISGLVKSISELHKIRKSMKRDHMEEMELIKNKINKIYPK